MVKSSSVQTIQLMEALQSVSKDHPTEVIKKRDERKSGNGNP